MTPARKTKIPASLKAEVWQRCIGDTYVAKCAVTWCSAQVTPFTFEAGHNIPESKGGETTVDNLRPICSKCNKAMGNRYTIDEYSATFADNGRGNNIDNTSTYAVIQEPKKEPPCDDEVASSNPPCTIYNVVSEFHTAKSPQNGLYIRRGLLNVMACFGVKSNAVKPITS